MQAVRSLVLQHLRLRAPLSIAAARGGGGGRVQCGFVRGMSAPADHGVGASGSSDAEGAIRARVVDLVKKFDKIDADKVWHSVLAEINLQQLALGQSDFVFADWWRGAVASVDKELWKGFNSLIILVTWMVWKQLNVCVFQAAQTNIDTMLLSIKNEAELWCRAGARGLSHLLALV